jgi:hypothetical protein
MTGNTKKDRGRWSRREVFRVGGMATAAGLMDGIAVTGAAPASQQGRAPLPAASAKGPQVTNGNRVEGSHIGRRLQGAVSGTIDGDRVRLRSSLPHEGTQLAYRFDGRVQGQTIEGEVDLGEYGTARWTARHVGQGSA